MARKRGLPSQSTQSTQSTQSSDTRPPNKKVKLTSTSISTSEPILDLPSIALPSSHIGELTSLPLIPNRLPLSPPPKRKHHEGKLRRLAISSRSTITRKIPISSDEVPSKVRPKSTLNGSKIGGKSKDLYDGIIEEEIWVNRHIGKGLGFSGYLKKGVQAVVERGMTVLRIHGMGAAIPLALSLSLAIRDALTEGGGTDHPAVKLEIRTGSIEVADEITPLTDDLDIIYQTRVKSTVEIVLRVSELMGVNGVDKNKRGNSGDRGSRRRGGGGSSRGSRGSRGGRGRGSSRGRGRGESKV